MKVSTYLWSRAVGKTHLADGNTMKPFSIIPFRGRCAKETLVQLQQNPDG